MAKQTITHLIDDLDDTSPADETVQFGLDGKRYEIDLTGANATRLRDGLAEFVAAARKAARPDKDKPAKPDHPGKRSDRDQNAAIRQWVRDNGGDIADRGRIPDDILAAYERGDTAAVKARQEEDTRPELVGAGATGDPFATFVEPQGSGF